MRKSYTKFVGVLSLQIDKPTFVKAMNMIKAYGERLDSLYAELESVIGDCEKLITKVDGVSDMIQLLEIACGDNRFISSYIFDTAWGKWDVMYATEGGREFAFKTLDDLWAVLNYTKPWELKLVLC